MSINKTLTIIILNVLAFTVSGQNILIRPWTGIGTYAMNDLKAIQKELQNINDIPLKGTDNYPPFICFGLDIIPVLTKNVGLGFTSSYHSTGARNHYADYSGSLTEDFLVNAPAGLTFPLDLSGAKIVISVEPDPDNGSGPFLLKPLVSDVANPATEHMLYTMKNNASGSNPTGTATR